MKNRLYIFFLFLISSSILWGQSYQGPAAGSVPNGVVVSTDDFSAASPLAPPSEKHVRNKLQHPDEIHMIDFDRTFPASITYFEDPNLTSAKSADTNATVLLKSFRGIAETNSIPPDPHIAAGPEHIVATVNSRFAIWDKEGNLIKNISADAWFNTTLNSPGAFDPKILYDQIDKRWIMVWLSQNDNSQTAYFLVSVSDDSNAIGTWYNWALPSHFNGTTQVTNWGDYQGVGFDKDAIYISTNQFTFGGSFQYVKIRILPKAQLYANTADAVEWNDIWDITYPHNSGRLFNIRPSITYGNPSEYYLIHAPSGGGNFMSVYTISDPLGTPSLGGFNIPVGNYNGAPNADQLGGSTTLIEGGGSAIRNEPTYRDGYLWAVHSIRNPNSSPNSSLRYVKLNLADSTADEDVAFGAPGYWHIYSAIAVDKDQNVAITYSRSGDNEYAGAFYTTRLANDPPGLSGSIPLQTGKGNYVKTFSGTRNRWGDYNGIWLDPVEQNNFWMFTEYAANTNTWGTWVGQIRLIPLEGVYFFADKAELEFGDIEVGLTSDTLNINISNYGEDDLIITDIPDSAGSFHLINNLIFPLTISTYDSLNLSFVFKPLSDGAVNEAYPIQSNDNNFNGFVFRGYGFQINPADNQLYASSGINNSGNILTINPSTAAGTLLGLSNFNEIKSIAIHPDSKIIYGINAAGFNTNLMRVNSAGGDSYVDYELNLTEMVSIAFDTSGVLYGALKDGKIYQIQPLSGDYNLVLDSSYSLAGMTFHPQTNELWASSGVLFGTNKEIIYKIDLATGDTTRVGRTGLNVLANDIAFDNSNNLFGITGSSSQISKLIQINTDDATGTTIGEIGFQHVTSIAFPVDVISSAEDNELEAIPSDFVLQQNYPNPFNPSTTIEFALPSSANVRLVVYNLLGEVVNVLLDNPREAGYHKVVWNADSRSGSKVTSGIYFYELKAVSDEGKEFTQMRKMILLK